MSYTFSEITFKQNLSILEEFSNWLPTIGIQTDGTRFHELIEWVRIIVSHYENNKVPKLLETYDEATLYTVLTDATSFVRVYDLLKDIKSHKLPRSKIKNMLRGPLLPWDESPDKDNIHSRNILFELETAAFFKRSGLRVTNYDDVQFTFKKIPINIQCKRIHSSKQVRDNINSAVAQFTKKMGKEPRMRGIICLCVDKVVDQEKLILEVDNEAEVGPNVDQFTRGFINSHNYLWQQLVNIRIIGTLVVFNSVALIKKKPHFQLTNCRHTVLDVIPNNTFHQQGDYRLIKSLSKKLNSPTLG